MISSKDGSSSQHATLLMTVAEFRVIFQVTKEAHALPPVALGRLSWDKADVTQIVDTARAIRALTDHADMVRIQIGQVAEPGTAATPEVMDVQVNEVAVRAVVAYLPGDLGHAWHELVESVMESLGARELFLRTGYSSDEIRAAASRLSVGDFGIAS